MLALVVSGAPAALTACEIVCAVRDTHAADEAAHSCHGTQPSDAPGIDSGVRVCGHDEALPAAASQTALLVALAPAPQAPAIVVSLDDVLPRVPVVASSAPGHPRLPVPLRI